MLTAKQAKELHGVSSGAVGQQQQQQQIPKKKDAPVLLLSAKQLEREAQHEQQNKAPQQQQSRPCLPVTTLELPFGSEAPPPLPPSLPHARNP